jgi:hypothetical protein
MYNLMKDGYGSEEKWDWEVTDGQNQMDTYFDQMGRKFHQKDERADQIVDPSLQKDGSQDKAAKAVLLRNGGNVVNSRKYKITADNQALNITAGGVLVNCTEKSNARELKKGMCPDEQEAFDNDGAFKKKTGTAYDQAKQDAKAYNNVVKEITGHPKNFRTTDFKNKFGKSGPAAMSARCDPAAKGSKCADLTDASWPQGRLRSILGAQKSRETNYKGDPRELPPQEEVESKKK